MNETLKHIMADTALINAILVEVEGMKVANLERQSNNKEMAYDESAFLALAAIFASVVSFFFRACSSVFLFSSLADSISLSSKNI